MKTQKNKQLKSQETTNTVETKAAKGNPKLEGPNRPAT